jgi:uncharacterized protein (TIGR02271 family)
MGMNLHLKDVLRNGMRVVGPDNRDYGAVERYDDRAIYVQGRAIPFDTIERVDQDRLYLGASAFERRSAGGRAAATTTGATDGASAELGGETRVPLREERLEFSTRDIDLGEIRIHKTVEATEESRRGPLTREDVQIERVRVDRPVNAPEERRQEGDWLIIPIMEEVFVVQKQLLVTEEIRIRKQPVTEEHEVREVIRRERATVEDTRPAPPPAATRAASSAQPAASDEAARGRRGDSDWDALHQEVRRADR